MITILFDFTPVESKYINKTTLRRAETNPTGPSCFAPGQICGAAVHPVCRQYFVRFWDLYCNY